MTGPMIHSVGWLAGLPFVTASLAMAAADGLPVDASTLSGIERYGFPVVVSVGVAVFTWKLVDRILTRAEKREDEARDMLQQRHAESMHLATIVLEGNKLLTEAIKSNSSAMETFARAHCANREGGPR
jgi:hypothetical protein